MVLVLYNYVMLFAKQFITKSNVGPLACTYPDKVLREVSLDVFVDM